MWNHVKLGKFHDLRVGGQQITVGRGRNEMGRCKKGAAKLFTFCQFFPNVLRTLFSSFLRHLDTLIFEGAQKDSLGVKFYLFITLEVPNTSRGS